MEDIKEMPNEKIIKLGQSLKRLKQDHNYECIKEIETFILQQAISKVKVENVYDPDTANDEFFRKAAKNKGFVEGMLYMVNTRNSFIDASDKLRMQEENEKLKEKEAKDGQE